MGTESIGGIESVRHCCAILRVVGSTAPGNPRAGRIADEVGLHRSTVHQYLRTLAEEGLVYQRGGGGYTTTFRFLEWGERKRRGWDLFQHGHAAIRELATDTGGEAELVTIGADGLVALDTERGATATEAFDESVPAGRSVPPHATAAGRAILAELPPDRVTALLDGDLTAHTDRTPTDSATVAGRLEAVPDRGYAVERQEYREGRCAVAAPIPDPRDRFAHAVSVALPAAEFDDRQDALADHVSAVADDLTGVIEEWYRTRGD